ncbi:FHA domain-containing protein [Synechococcus sp. C9]|uniref:FHA domain-containing protein n=1 Tax=Synechococcus sp. C9 TaxID=102119 RepID=UPI001FF29654|nr:FHA domain-containing protein [Synechococcus sp. C9]
MPAPLTADDTSQRLHILVVEDPQGQQVLALEAATYSIGRDATSAIVFHADSVSRQHALLLRVPIPGSHEYHYQIQDGNAAGKTSTNGIKVNGIHVSHHTLTDGDVVEFAPDAHAIYYHGTALDPQISKYLHAAEFRSIKAPVVEQSLTEVAGLMVEPAPNPIPEAVTQHLAPAPATPTPPPARIPWLWLLAGIAVGLLLMGGIWWFQQRLQPQPSTRNPDRQPLVI